jgi:hypothetical protein
MQEIRTWSPFFSPGHAIARLRDNADTFMAEDTSGLASRHIAFEDMKIGATYCGVNDFYNGVCGVLNFSVWVGLRGIFFPDLGKRALSLIYLLKCTYFQDMPIAT